ncbi:amidohydrolase family protein [Nocardioides sp. cx-169]|uniref:amidohydrolase family protein n=1 Tax=Nocardioides sp. cx-169 TaxID=2899080 RepID=UPI001E518DE6|nr:amidohydrolase family protein [Nocardioides sp. cx-169]MCD4533548.1 amidohydrolase family protein [Nocardioides sp. cx-169]
MRTLLTGGVVLTGPAWVPGAADVLVEDGRVVEVGRLEGAERLDAARVSLEGRLVMPGLVNAHTHSHTLPARGASRTWTLEDSLLNGGWMSGLRSEELAELCALLAAAEMIASGATGAFDLMAQAGGPDPAGLAAAVRGYARAGLRVVLAPMVADRSVHEAVPAIGGCCGLPPGGVRAETVVARCREFAAQSFPPLVAPAVAPTILAHCTPELVAGLLALADEHDLRVHTHLAESKPQALSGAARFGRSITSELARQGVLGPRLTAAHAIWLSAEDRGLLGATSSVAVAVPGSNLRLGSGTADTRALLEAGVTLAVGTDGANSADALDVLDAARLTALMSRTSTRPASSWLTVEEVLTAATAGGAAACGWDDVGRIAPGYAADLAVLDLGARAFLPPNDLANQVLTAARASDVTDVMVAGRWVYRDRVFPGLELAAASARFRDLALDLQERHVAARERASHESALAAPDLADLRAVPWTEDRLLP